MAYVRCRIDDVGLPSETRVTSRARVFYSALESGILPQGTMLLRTLTALVCLSTAVFSQVVGSALPRQVRPEAAPVEYKPEELCTVSGIVRDAVTGQPLRKASLQLMSVQQRTPTEPLNADTNGDGAFVFSGVEPGEYRLMANRTGYVGREFGASNRQGFGSGTQLKLEKAQKLSQLEFKLIPHAVLTGRIVDEDGDPIAHAHVQLMRFRYLQGSRQLLGFSSATTNDLGEYRIFSVAPGKYYLSATSRPNYMMSGAGIRADASGAEEGYSATYYPGVNSPASAVQIEVAQGSRMQGLDVKLLRTRTFRVSGQLVIPGGGRPPVQIMLTRRDNIQNFDRGMSAMPGPTGKFVIRGVQPGAYDVVAHYFTPELQMSLHAPVDVTNTNVEVGTLSFTPGPAVTGTVRGEGETAPALDGLMVYLRPAQPQQMMMSSAMATVKPDGTFTMKNALRAKAWVTMARLPDGYYLKSARHGEVDLLADTFDLSTADNAALELVLSPKAAQVQGKVVDAKGLPANAATVVLIPVSEEKRKRQDLWSRVQTDQTGGFSFKSRAPGEYYLLAAMDLEFGEEADPDFLKTLDGRAEKIELKESAMETKQLKLPAPQ